MSYGSWTPRSRTINNIGSDRPNKDFAAQSSVSVSITSPKDGEIVSGAVIITAGTSSTSKRTDLVTSLAVTKVEFYCDTTLLKTDAQSPFQCRWDCTKVSNGNHILKAKVYDSSSITAEDEITVNVQNSNALLHIVLNRSQLNFGATVGGSQTGVQTFLVSNSGGSQLNWNAVMSDAWIQATPLTGGDGSEVFVTVDTTGLSQGSYDGTITVSDTSADNSPVTLSVYLEINSQQQDQPPFGGFDAPVDGSVVAGMIPIAGWALDDTEVASVKIYRDSVVGEVASLKQISTLQSLIYIGDAVFVEGARPDVEASFSGYPNCRRSGWGLLLLTNSLPNQGNGTFVITAIAMDNSGNQAVLGSKTIYCDNTNSVKPFGAIDTPTLGGDASGQSYINWGWALTPQPNTIPTDGSTIKVWVDGVPLGNPVYNQYREDIATLFPGYSNSNGAAGYYYLDTTLYANGMHTIAWSVRDDAGNRTAIGSRYFNIVNTGSSTVGSQFISINGISSQSQNRSDSPLYFKRGYNLKSRPELIYPSIEGTINIEIEENERIEIRFKDEAFSQSFVNTRFTGCLLYGDKSQSLPIGSYLDSKKGIFYWQPGSGFIGEYKLLFIEKSQNIITSQRVVKVNIAPKSK